MLKGCSEIFFLKPNLFSFRCCTSKSKHHIKPLQIESQPLWLKSAWILASTAEIGPSSVSFHSSAVGIYLWLYIIRCSEGGNHNGSGKECGDLNSWERYFYRTSWGDFWWAFLLKLPGGENRDGGLGYLQPMWNRGGGPALHLQLSGFLRFKKREKDGLIRRLSKSNLHAFCDTFIRYEYV